MNYIAKTRCPNCGKIESHNIDENGFKGKEVTVCSNCEYVFYNEAYCTSKSLERPNSSSSFGNCLAQFTTQELEMELKRRKG